MIRRITLFSFLLLVLFALFTIAPNGPATSAMSNQAPPTNTRRPVTPTRPPTNTPRATFTLVPSQTPSDTATFVPSETPTPQRVIIGPTNYPPNYNSLTGQLFPDEAARERRNLIVKVSNYTWLVRPQDGLSQADIVYEYEVEGGVTRFAAIYRSKGAEHVGSIRSGRLMDLELMATYNAILAYSGSNDPIRTMILYGSCIDATTGSRAPCPAQKDPNATKGLRSQTLTPQFGDNCPPFCRFPEPGLPFEHTLFGNTFQMWNLASTRNNNTGTIVKGMAFSDSPDDAGKTASDIAIKWYGDQDMRWQYNPADQKYYRFNTGYPHVDKFTGNQLTADNVVVIETYHKNRPDIYESESGSPAVEVQLWGSEKAWLFRDGQWFAGNWTRARNRESSGLSFTYDDGTPMAFKPGQTWVEVVRCCNMNGVTVSDDLADMQGTSTLAVMTATSHGIKMSPEAATKTMAAMKPTNDSAYATMGVSVDQLTAQPGVQPTDVEPVASWTPSPTVKPK